MFTLKLYRHGGNSVRIVEADFFTIHKDLCQASQGKDMQSWSEITAHHKVGDDERFDIGSSPYVPSGGVWDRAIIENSAGRTTEMITPIPQVIPNIMPAA